MPIIRSIVSRSNWSHPNPRYLSISADELVTLFGNIIGWESHLSLGEMPETLNKLLRQRLSTATAIGFFTLGAMATLAKQSTHKSGQQVLRSVGPVKGKELCTTLQSWRQTRGMWAMNGRRGGRWVLQGTELCRY